MPCDLLASGTVGTVCKICGGSGVDSCTFVVADLPCCHALEKEKWCNCNSDGSVLGIRRLRSRLFDIALGCASTSAITAIHA